MIAAKINFLYSQRKNQSMEKQMKKIRNQFLDQRRKEIAYSIILESSSNIQKKNLKLLVQLASSGQEESIIHLGNLLIDGVIEVADIEELGYKPSKNQYCVWLMRILYENKYMTVDLLEFLFIFIEEQKGSFLDEHALPFLA